MRRTMLCFAPAHNTKGRKDATGAFIPEARRFLVHHNQDPTMLVLVDNHHKDATMRKEVISALNRHLDLEGVFFFCHGYRSGIQFGFRTKHLEELAAAMARSRHLISSPAVCFYSCDVARDSDRQRDDDLETVGGDGGFADGMRDALCSVGAVWCSVDGHTTPGHTTKNPHVRRFEGEGSRKAGRGGYYIIPRTNRKLFKRWRELLRTNFRFDYPLLTTDKIISKVGGK